MSATSMTVVTRGATLATGAASASVPIPTSSGQVPQYVRLASTGACYVSITNGAGTAAAGDLLIQPGDSIPRIRTKGLTHINAIQVSAAGVLQISPLEDQ